MMKYILLIVVLSFISSISNGQNLDKAIDAAVDARYKKGMIPVEGYDSIQNAIVNNYIQKEVLPLGIFNWPSQVIRFYPSETYKYLLVHKYNIGRPILHGCIVASYQYCYDSIIANELRKKYGNDFFEKTKAEADLLDSNKMGVTLPYLFNSQDNAISAIKKEMPLIDTFRFENNDDSLRFIILNFKGNALINAYFRRAGLGYSDKP